MRVILFIIFLSIIVFVAYGDALYAEEALPEFLLTWRAESYVPADFGGRILPTKGSQIVASFELVQDGKILDLSKETVHWYLDDELLKSGRGLKTVSFKATQDPGGTHDVRIQINNFRNQRKIAVKTIDIPVARPEAVIDAPFPENRLVSSNVRLVARPYFFTVKSSSDLRFSWEVNGEKPAAGDRPDELLVNLSNVTPGSNLNIKLTVQHPLAIFQGAVKSLTLTYAQ